MKNAAIKKLDPAKQQLIPKKRNEQSSADSGTGACVAFVFASLAGSSLLSASYFLRMQKDAYDDALPKVVHSNYYHEEKERDEDRCDVIAPAGVNGFYMLTQLDGVAGYFFANLGAKLLTIVGAGVAGFSAADAKNIKSALPGMLCATVCCVAPGVGLSLLLPYIAEKTGWAHAYGAAWAFNSVQRLIDDNHEYRPGLIWSEDYWTDKSVAAFFPECFKPFGGLNPESGTSPIQNSAALLERVNHMVGELFPGFGDSEWLVLAPEMLCLLFMILSTFFCMRGAKQEQSSAVSEGLFGDEPRVRDVTDEDAGLTNQGNNVALDPYAPSAPPVPRGSF